MKKSFLFTIFLCFPLFVAAQSLRQQVTERIVKKAKQPQSNIPSNSASVVAKTDPDTVYCLSTKKQHGWFMPMDVVSLKYAKQHGDYIMFTRKNSASHWTKLETFDAYGNRKSGRWTPYILSNDDPQGDENWIKKVKTGCICEMISDPQGESVVQERVYDKDMNLVFSFSRSPIGERKYIGSYKDVYGLPAEMRKDSTFTYGTLVVITEDIWGNDSLIEYVDAKGTPKNNSNGVGMQFYIYDKDGRDIRQGSANHNGEYVIDNWGNCGTESFYDKKTGKQIASINMDNKWNPIPLPNLRKEAGWSAGITKRLYKYDQYGRLSEQKFVTIENKPDTNMYGTHRIVYTHDKFGNITSYNGYDIDGNLVPYEESGEAKEIIEYDTKGRAIYYEFYDKNNHLLSTDGYLSRLKKVYGSDDNLDEHVRWCILNGKEDTCYYYKRTPNSYYLRHYDGSYKIDSLDNKGRTILTAYYNADGTPSSNGKEGFHKEKTTIKEFDKRVTCIYENYDSLGYLTGKYPIRLITHDSVNWTIEHKYFNSCRQMEYTIRNEYRNDFITRIKEIDINSFGNVCRSGGVGTLYYYADILKNQRGEYTAGACRDEFGEPDYSSTPSYYIRFTSKGVVDYDENNNKIVDFDKFKNICLKAMSIEVTDSSAYALGIKDNDIILCYGESYQLIDTIGYWDFLGKWSVAQIFEAPKNKSVLVFRINPETKDYGLFTFTLPKGNPSQLGFIVHPTFKTQRQHARIQKAISKYCQECVANGTTCLWKSNIDKPTNERNIVVAFSDLLRTNRYQPYPLQVTDPSIILVYNVPTMEKIWLLGQDADKLNNISSLRRDSHEEHPINFYYTKDGQSLDNKCFTESTNGFSFFNYRVTNSQYKQLEKLVKQAKKDIEKKGKEK